MSYNIKFEDRTLRGLRVPEGKDRQEWSDTVVPGLRFRKSEKGHGAFSVVYRVKGHAKQDRRTIGPFPRVSIAQARGEAREDLNAAGSGRDPKQLRTAPPEVPEVQELTFTELFETYMDRHARESLSSWRDIERKIRKDALPVIGDMPVKEVRKRHLHLVIDRLVSGGHAVTARHLLSMISTVFTWAEGRELVEYNPVLRFPHPKPAEPPQRRSLTDEQMRTLFFALVEIADTPPTLPRRGMKGCPDLLALVILSRLLLGQRTTETIGMRRQDLEAEWWNLPGYVGRRRYTKTGREHRVPLVPLWTEYVLPRIEGLTAGRPLVFASDRRPDQSLSPMSTRPFCKRVAAELGFPFVARNLRTTFLTTLARLRIPQEVRMRMVNHTDGSIETMHYNLYDYDTEKWAAGLRWDAHLRSLFFGETAQAVG
jgi:Arm DNA-binding domain/Phage integrase family